MLRVEREDEWPPARRDFHIALLVSFLPLLSVPVSWILAWVAGRRSPRRPSETLWLRALCGLAILDTIIALVLVVGLPHLAVGMAARAAQGPRPTLGVRLETSPERSEGPGCAVASVLPNTPASRVGISPGDRLLRVDDMDLSDCGALRRAMAAKPAGTLRRFAVQRGQQVVLVAAAPLPPRALARRRALFETEGPCEARGINPGELRALVVLGVLLLIAFVGWRRGAPRPFVVFASLAGTLLAGYLLVPLLFQLGACRLLGGKALGPALLGLLCGPALVCGMMAVTLRRLGRLGLGAEGSVLAKAEPMLGAAACFGLGLGYAFAGIWRIRVLGLFVEGLTFGAGGGNDPAFAGLLSAATATPAALALFALAAALVGPLAEELMMRGLLLPWLARWIDVRLALLVSALAFALLHAQYGAVDLVAVAWLGLVFGWARLSSGRLWPAVALHMAVNGLGVLLAAIGS